MNERRGPELHQRWLQDAQRINAAILERFATMSREDALQRTHHFQGRFENTYVPLERIPELQPVVDLVLAEARAILMLNPGQPLRYGFWFNEMGPGHVTSLHHHDEDDELLSACYYLRVPPDSGRFVAVEGGEEFPLQPQEGLLLLFSPTLPYQVEENRGNQTRLSVAFNIGRGWE